MFCKKCHKRIVEKVRSNVDLSRGTVKICLCGNRDLFVHGPVIKRLVSEFGVHKVKKSH